MRIRKDPEVRQTELIDAAVALFSCNGYEKTMIIDIVKKAGVAKGTFFYYFPTKEAVLEAFCARWASEQVTSFKGKSHHCTALEKLRLFIDQLFLPSQLDLLFDRLIAENQFKLLYKLLQQLETVFSPLLADIIRQGNEEGSMQVAWIDDTIAFFWSTLDCLWEAMYNDEAPEAFGNKIKIAESILERMLGIEAEALKVSIVRR